MKTIYKTLSFIVIGALVFTMSSCKKEGCTDETALNFNQDAKKDNGSCTYETGNAVNLNINHKYGNDIFSFDSIYADPQGTKYQFTRTEFYFSNFMFMDDNMASLGMTDKVFLVKNTTTNLSLGSIDLVGHVHMMNTKIGLDSLRNFTTDPATMPAGDPLSLQAPSMYWTWNSGYIFFAVEGVYDSNGNQMIDAGDATFEMHLGGNNFQVNNSFMVHQDLAVNQPLNLTLDLDYSQLFLGFDLMNDNSTHTMDNMPLAMALKANLANFISLN